MIYVCCELYDLILVEGDIRPWDAHKYVLQWSEERTKWPFGFKKVVSRILNPSSNEIEREDEHLKWNRKHMIRPDQVRTVLLKEFMRRVWKQPSWFGMLWRAPFGLKPCLLVEKHCSLVDCDNNVQWLKLRWKIFGKRVPSSSLTRRQISQVRTSWWRQHLSA